MTIADADDFTPPPAVRVEHGDVSTCPTCGKAIKRHTSLELLRCADAIDAPDDGDEHVEAPSEFETWKEARPTPSGAASPPPPVGLETGDERTPQAITAEDVRAGIGGLPDIRPALGSEIDYEALAVALRTTIERERDEIVRKGGPIEKQNQELKQRLAQMLDEVSTWRRRHQAAVEARNSLQEQLTELQKSMRKERAAAQRLRAGGRAKVTNTADILKVCEHTPGITVKRQGNGHFGIYKDGVWITDMASSPGQERANMNTRVLLRKAGVDV